MIRIKEVKPLDDYKLLITFENNEKKIKDMKPYLFIWWYLYNFNWCTKGCTCIWSGSIMVSLGYRLN